MKIYFVIFFLFFPPHFLLSQRSSKSLYDQLNKTTNDTLKIFLLDQIGASFFENNWDSASYYEEKSLLLAKQIHFPIMEAYLYDATGYINTHKGNLPQALAELLKGIDISQNSRYDNDHLTQIIF
jgi:hypothetical protein